MSMTNAARHSVRFTSPKLTSAHDVHANGAPTQTTGWGDKEKKRDANNQVRVNNIYSKRYNHSSREACTKIPMKVLHKIVQKIPKCYRIDATQT